MHSKQQNDVNYPSLLLNPTQNALVFSLLGKKCYTLATAVVQLVITEPSSLNKWSLKTTGVVCFVKDHPRRSYFIKVYDCDKRTLTWQQEVYLSFEYRTPRPYFHTFEGHDCIVGLNFASEQEAHQFKEAILGKLKDREKKKIDRLKHNGTNNNPNKGSSSSYTNNNNISVNEHNNHKHLDFDGSMNNPTVNTNRRQNGAGNQYLDTNQQARLQHTVSARLRPTQTGAAASIPVSAMQKSQSALLGNLNNNLILTNNSNKGDKKKLNKRDIGLPTNFQHVTHVGFSPQTGFDLENVNPSMKKDLQKLFADSDQQPSQPLPPPQPPSQSTVPQLPTHQPQSHQTHINSHNHHYPAPPPPPVPPIPSPTVLNKPRAQSNGSHQNQNNLSTQADKVGTNGTGPALQSPPVPPPPPPPRPLPPMPSHGTAAKSPRPPAQTNNNHAQHIERPATNGAPQQTGAPAPPPPPPPPPPGALTGPVTPKVGSATSNNQAKSGTPAIPPVPSGQLDMHAALMSQLLKGKQLNHVDPNAEKRSPHPSVVANSHDDPRSALMNQIKAGVKLKTVSSNQSKPAANPQPTAASGLAGALAKALQERSKVLQQTDESQSSSGEDAGDDDEWDES